MPYVKLTLSSGRYHPLSEREEIELLKIQNTSGHDSARAGPIADGDLSRAAAQRGHPQ